MNKDKETRRIHYTVASLGGFFGGFAILMHHNILSNAQTSNLLSLVIALMGRSTKDVLLHTGSMLLYMTGLSLTVLIPRYRRWDLRVFSLIIDAVALCAIGLMPPKTDNFLAIYPIFFAASIQWNSFPGADGYVSATVFSTNNLRQFTTSLVGYACDREKKFLHKAGFYGRTLLGFHLGVVLAYIATRCFGSKGAFLAFLPWAQAVALLIRSMKNKKDTYK